MSTQLPFYLKPHQIDELARLTGHGTRDFHRGYEYILQLHSSGEIALDRDTQYWFQQAREINANDPNSPANVFIRAHTMIGLDHAGRSGDLQTISDAIGRLVVRDLLAGEMMTFDRMWRQDIAVVTGNFGLPVGGWGGSFYYWDRRLSDTDSRTIGEFIMGDAFQRNTFIDAMAFASTATLGKMMVDPGVMTDLANVQSMLKALSAGLDNLPFDVKWDIMNRALERTYDHWSREIGDFAGKSWSDIQKAFQRMFGGMFDDFELIDHLLKKFHDSMQIVSPLVLDLDGNGFASTGLLGGTQFDHDANGYAERTGWVQGQDGLLVLDRDGNGRIDSGRELFGSETLLADGSKAANGFETLAELDANRDGRIDAQDAAYANLRVWRDRNGDGLVTEAELSTLADADVAGIGTAYTNVNIVDSHGNTTKQVGGFTRSDGSTGQTADIWFATDPARSRVWDLLPETPAVAALPDLAGYGNLPSLRQAMLRDATSSVRRSAGRTP